MLTGTFDPCETTAVCRGCPQETWLIFATKSTGVTTSSRTEVETGQAGEDGTIYRQHVHQGPGTSWRRIEAHVSGFRRRLRNPWRRPGARWWGRRSSSRQLMAAPWCGPTIRIALAGPGKLLQPIVRRELDRRLDTYPIDLKRRLDQLHR